VGLKVSYSEPLARSSSPVIIRYVNWTSFLGYTKFIAKQYEEWADAQDENLVSLDGEISMLRKIVLLAIVVGTLLSCRSHKNLMGDHPSELVGTWQLLIRSSCTEYGLKSDQLVLHPDGIFEQHIISSSGKRNDVTGQHWQYQANGGTGHIALDKRLESFTPEFSGNSKGQSVATFEVLIVELKSEPVIVLHPDSDCVYNKIQ